MPGKDYYAILGVSKSASPEDIKKAFRRLAHEHHPDKGGDQQKFKDVNEAYQVLGDPAKRAQYDQFGSAAFESGMGGPGGFGGFDPFAGQGGFTVNMEDFGDLGDILGGMFGFGGRRGGRRVPKGEDIHQDLVLDFKEAVFGVSWRIKLYKPDVCHECHGNGAASGSKLENCKTCGGKGQVSQSQRTIFGSFQVAVNCPDCQGQGQKPDKICSICKGSGKEKREKELEVQIPSGISNEEALRVTGEGEYPGAGGKAGDLILHIRIKAHPVLSREGNDILSTIEAPYSMLMLGGRINIETVDGTEELKIPSGTPSGAVFKLRGKGVPFLRSHGRGDHLVTVKPLVTTRLTREQEEALEQLRKLGL